MSFSHTDSLFCFLKFPLPSPTTTLSLFSNLNTKMEMVTSISASQFGCCISPPTTMKISTLNSKFHPSLPPRASAMTKMVADGFVGGVGGGSLIGTSTTTTMATSRIYKRLGSCLVIPPPKGRKPRALLKFLGGAFIGAVPEVTYSYLIELLAKEGFLVIVVPYNVTFDHARAAAEVYERFNACLDTLLDSGLPDSNLAPAHVADLPLFSLGHSNGALLQLLTGSYYNEKIPKANAIISFNNRPATEAVPYFELFGPLVSQMMPFVEASPLYSMAVTASGDAWKALLDTAGTIIPNNDQESLVSLTKFVDQLPSVMNQVREGVSEFRPTPIENRDCFKNSYNVPHTLLVKFSSDTIDETDLLEDTLKPRVESMGGTLEKVELSGNHITPCIQEPKWQVGDVYTPADALAQGLKTLSLNDTKVLSRTISDWFKRFED